MNKLKKILSASVLMAAIIAPSVSSAQMWHGGFGRGFDRDDFRFRRSFVDRDDFFFGRRFFAPRFFPGNQFFFGPLFPFGFGGFFPVIW